MKLLQGVGLGLLLGLGAHSGRAQETPPPDEIGKTISAADTAAPPRSAPRRREAVDFEDTIRMGLTVEHRRPVNGDYEYSTHASIFSEMDLGKYDSVSIVVGGGVFQLKTGSEADLAMHQPYFGEFAVLGRHYFTPAHAFLRPYVSGSLSGVLIGWQYRTPVTIPGDQISRDWTVGIGAYAGAGLSAGLRNNLQVFGEVGVGGVGIADETGEGAETQPLDSFGYVGVKAGFSLTF